MASIPIIQLKEVTELGDGLWEVEATGPGLSLTIKLQDPFDSNNEKDLMWFLESHSRDSPYESKRAEKISDQLTQYGRSLVAQLQPLAIIQELKKRTHDNPIILDVVDSRSGSSFHKLHWEVLENPASWSLSLESVPLIVCRAVLFGDCVHPDVVSPESPNPVSKPSFNILLVAARPDKADDIDPLLGARSLVEVLKEIPAERSMGIKLEVCRPGTWVAFKKHLAVRTQDWRDQGGQGPWFDLVHFDIHGELTANGDPYLIFLSKSGRHSLAVSASQVASVLKEYGVPSVFLNSCESAKTIPHKTSNLARLLVSSGVCRVLAMSFKFTSSAARLFISTFYSTYLTDGVGGMLRAVHFARRKLLQDKQRSGRFGLTVHLEDFIIPVLYAADHEEPSVLLATRRHMELATVVEPSDTPQVFSPLFFQRYQQYLNIEFTRTVPNFIGREQDVLELETRLLKNPRENILLLYGMAGIGKTTLLNFLGWWWGYTELGTFYVYFSLHPISPVPFRTFVQDSDPSTLAELSRSLRENNCIFILDDIDTISWPTVEPHRPFSSEDKRKLKDFVDSLRGGRSLVLLASRSQESWLDVQRYHLRGLAYYHCTTLASNILKGLSLLRDKENTEYLGHLITHLNFNPSAILSFLKALTFEGASSVKTPKELFERLQSGGCVFVHTDDLLQQECFRFVRRIHDHNAEHSMLLQALVPFWKHVREDFFGVLATRLQREKHSQSPTGDDVADFFFASVVKSGWMEITDSPSQPGQRYFRIHPLLTNTLRFVANSAQFMCPIPHWPGASLAIFAGHLSLRALEWVKDSGIATMRYELRQETSNFLFAYDLQLANFTNEIELDVAFTLLIRIWCFAVTSNSPDVSMDALQGRCKDFLTTLEKISSDPEKYTPETLLFFSLSICYYLGEFYVSNYPSKAEYYINRGIAAFESAPPANKLSPQLLLLDGFSRLNQGRLAIYGEGDMDKAQGIFLSVLDTELGSAEPTWEFRKKLPETLAFTHLAELELYSDKYAQTREGYLEKAAERNKAFIALSSEVDGFRHLPCSSYTPAIHFTQLVTGDWVPDVTQWMNSELGRSGLMRTIPFSLEAGQLINDGHPEAAKVVLLKGVEHAMLTKDVIAEFPCQETLASLSIKEKDWPTAAGYIDRIVAIMESTQGGFTLPSAPLLKAVNLMIYGTVYWRLGRYKDASALYRKVPKLISNRARAEMVKQPVKGASREELWTQLMGNVQVLDDASKGEIWAEMTDSLVGISDGGNHWWEATMGPSARDPPAFCGFAWGFLARNRVITNEEYAEFFASLVTALPELMY